MLAVSDLQLAGGLSICLAVSGKKMAAQTTPVRRPLHKEHDTFVSTGMCCCLCPASLRAAQLAGCAKPADLNICAQHPTLQCLSPSKSLRAATLVQWMLCYGFPSLSEVFHTKVHARCSL